MYYNFTGYRGGHLQQSFCLKDSGRGGLTDEILRRYVLFKGKMG